MEIKYVGKTNTLGFEHNKVYDITIEKPKNYYTYLITAFTSEKELKINYASINSIKANWKITETQIDELLKE